MTTVLHVPHPERWWLARRRDMPGLTDPDEDDGQVRHHDRDARAWLAIAGVLQTAAHAIAHPGHPVDPDDPTVALVEVDLAELA